ncbi:hypothetical protein PVL29_008504 [Vitis rotundifolia]|uniref:Uncharacterized protein n=1 Tax=Vitis rotundifolia TaxID=103349 RepID=A0AA38ZWF8_VITRO|nr:hypothetical protein PVL29_008504 [Vitis rotundifolia]
MQKEEYDSKPLGICHRLFNLVLSRLIGFRPPVSTDVPIEYKNRGDKKRGSPQAQLQKGPETVPVKDQRNELPAVRDIAISNGKTSADQLQDKGPPMVMPNPKKGGKASGTAGKVRLPIEEGNMKERPWPSVTLVTNINEMSDDFIRQRKEAMQRTNTMEPKKF